VGGPGKGLLAPPQAIVTVGLLALAPLAAGCGASAKSSRTPTTQVAASPAPLYGIAGPPPARLTRSTRAHGDRGRSRSALVEG
jgi:hypothetical protein